MIDGLNSEDVSWLSDFFSAPNDLTWQCLQDGSAQPDLAEQVRHCLQALADPDSKAPIILPFVKSGDVVGWYATTRSSEGGHELGAELQGWLGPTYLSVFEKISNVPPINPSAAALSRRSNGIVWKFTGANEAAKAAISMRLTEYIGLLLRRPEVKKKAVRPVGAIRGDFERALLAKDAASAEQYIAELKDTGRLNEENLRYLNVRLSAGLGLWPQIARDHWLIQTMSDLALPPRILSDIVEALYRTYIDSVEDVGDVTATLAAFDELVAKRYPRLFASRRGIKTPRVVKAFLLFEQLQARPCDQIIADLSALLDDGDKNRVLAERTGVEAPPIDAEAQADEAFDDLQYDRAFALFAALPLSKKTIGRLLTCAQFIDTADARARLFALVDDASPDVIDKLTPAMRDKLSVLKAPESKSPAANTDPIFEGVPEQDSSADSRTPESWMAWAEHIQWAEDLGKAEQALQFAVTNWTTSEFSTAVAQSQIFADIIGNLSGDAAKVARLAVPQIFESFFPEDAQPSATFKPIAKLLFDLVVIDDSLSSSDLELISQLISIKLQLGLSQEEYLAIISDLDDVQGRIRSYKNLPWSLDICEILAVSPAQTDTARSARLAFFLAVLGHAQAFAHRLGPQDFVPMELLAKDFGVDPSSIDALRRAVESNDPEAEQTNLSGKLIGIYTLAVAAGARAKASLERMFSGCRVEVNSDLVATDKLKNLARTADLFVFAWKSSSHAAFYCIKDELSSGEPIWPTGKGTASIIRAVLENARPNL